jgi:hypothetical protein
VDPWPSRREIYGNSLPVSALIYACVFELIASRMQSDYATKDGFCVGAGGKLIKVGL